MKQLFGAIVAGLAVSLAGCAPVGYGGYGGPIVYSGGYYGGYGGPVYAGGYYGGYGYRHAYHGGAYRHGGYYHGGYRGGAYHGGHWRR